MAYTRSRADWQDGPGGATPIREADLDNMDRGIADAHELLGGARPLSSFAGADASAKFRQACSDVAGMSPKPVVVIPHGTTLDAGTTPFSLPTGFAMLGTLGVETEYGYLCQINIRHTGSSTSGVFKMASGGSKGQTFKGICFNGTSSTRAFQDSNFDTTGDYWRYVTFDNVSFNGFDSIYQGPLLGFRWLGQCYLNNFSCNREPFYVSGSDNDIWSAGAFMECGNIGTYANAASCNAMIRFGTLAKTFVGPMYSTGSPTTPFRLDGGDGGILVNGTTIEGRPVPGGGPRYLWAAGELVRLTGGRSTWRSKWWGYAMRDPSATGRSPGGFIHITGGDHVIDGGTFQPFTAADYGGTIPPFIYITGGTVNVKNITQGPNATSLPVVKYSTLANIKASDASVTLSAI